MLSLSFLLKHREQQPSSDKLLNIIRIKNTIDHRTYERKLSS